MPYSLKYIFIYSFPIGIILLNFFYFIPHTAEWLFWKSGITMGYVGIELIGNYCIHMLFIYACFTLIKSNNIIYSFSIGFILAGLSIVSFFLAFRIIDWIVFVFAFLYAGLFCILFSRSANKNSRHDNAINVYAFFASFIWLIIDFKYLS